MAEVPGPARRAWGATWPKLLAVAIAVAVWQIAVWTGWKPDHVLPGPAAVGRDLWAYAGTDQLWGGLATTMRRAVVGFATAVTVGLVLGLAVARNSLLRAAAGSMITSMQTMPSIAWFPLAILVFRPSEQAIFLVVVLGAAPSVANAVIHAVDHIPPLWLRAGRSIGASGLALHRYVIAPAALPAIVAGLKQGWAFAWRSLMAGELLNVAAKTSLGAQLHLARESSQPERLISVMMVILFVGIGVDAMFGAADRAIRRRWGLDHTSV